MRISIVAIIILLLTFNSSFAQLIEPPPNSSQKQFYNYYKLKQTKNKNIGLVLLGAGAIIVIGNYISYSNSSTTSMFGNIPNTSQIVVFGIGGASTLASIPFFISSGKHKKKANLYINGESVNFSNLSKGMSKNFSIALTLEF